MKTFKFAVDAALLQELGDRLIGRPEIALAELIKNAYDADATLCTVTFGKNNIEVTDNGHGMTVDEFEKHWMRIGTTHKATQGTSRDHKRPLTGSKGIGRLAAQFLSRELELSTVTASDPKALYALVDWGKIERGKDLATVTVEWEQRVSTEAYPGGSKVGTRIKMSGLKDIWTEKSIADLGREIWALRSPFRYQGIGSSDPKDFDVQMEAPGIAGAKERLDETLATLFSSWKARITGSLQNGRRDGRATIAIQFARDYPEGEPAGRVAENVVLPILKDGDDKEPCYLDNVSFDIMIYKLEGRQPGKLRVGDVRDYLAEFGSVSVYDTGFRLPYYGVDQDWLKIAIDQSRRISISELLPDRLKINERYMLDLPAPGRIFGHVDINTSMEAAQAQKAAAKPGTWLQLQPGRDRLQQNLAYDQLERFVRYALDLYANRYKARELRHAERGRSAEPPSQKQQRALRVLERHREEMPPVAFREVKRELGEALKASTKEEAIQDSRAALLAPLAAAGMAVLAFNHELEREERLIRKAVTRLRRVARATKNDELMQIADELGEALDRRATLKQLFAPLTSEEDRSVENRLHALPVARSTASALEPITPGLAVQLDGIPEGLLFPLGSAAEWNALLQNVITNAWNATMSQPKPVLDFTGGTTGAKSWLRISDNGQGLGVPLEEASKLFEPFERKLEVPPDQRSIAIGGEGLGLAVVKMIATRRRASVAFVEPPPGYSTCLELSWRS